MQNFPIITATIAYTNPKLGKLFILIIHQALHFPEMKRCLLCPMKMKLNDVVLNEPPKFLTTYPSDQDLAIVLEDITISLDI
jgi:hypothetical protein